MKCWLQVDSCYGCFKANKIVTVDKGEDVPSGCRINYLALPLNAISYVHLFTVSLPRPRILNLYPKKHVSVVRVQAQDELDDV